jgi:biopolymer transport protein ExbD
MDITPLIDVVFQLIIFFVLTTTFARDQGVKVRLPAADAAAVERQATDVLIVIPKDGAIVVDSHATDLPSLERHLRARARSAPETLVIIHADEAVPHGRVVRVMDVARDAGLERLAIGTRPEAGSR